MTDPTDITGTTGTDVPDLARGPGRTRVYNLSNADFHVIADGHAYVFPAGDEAGSPGHRDLPTRTAMELLRMHPQQLSLTPVRYAPRDIEQLDRLTRPQLIALVKSFIDGRPLTVAQALRMTAAAETAGDGKDSTAPGR